ncbi:YihY/virulence factor BrkB family protein [Haloferax sp. Atlit-10N]|uniref:Ribonuclease BN n=1 Tax=Haloferax prahovense (strain DSM 18310 / JCM 13924 / TL6) TaxID=1227461 RepID=M0GSV3_HALPT|nr:MULTISPECIES: YihY/virulence factor BrkB family protein [Haloferax]ELZ73939.1 ribonuclease BN [Haloferax prahovense DSM 18310]RDZ42930.1 YihY/virulence factor BrkB family protein [Haloferax sp. Atlit-19N]RDZ43076.1 YihY/virulence factor BrkB family protein [Haloferax sp. Atlit-16N]RDZ57651.1 YihY/virulence factor BrkB family protein [Haloferax sp. Atlit-10N]REA06100.1 YihY/virulence factor BrkB family protein [Haloferax sp. Atlit-6N]
MSAKIRTVVPVARAVVDTIREKEISFLAASISYYALVSLIPLLVLGVVVATAVGGAELQAQLQTLVERYLVPTGQDLVEEALTDRAGQGSVGAVSLALTVWGALKLFRGLDIAFSRIYGSEAGGLLDQLRDGTIALASIGVGTIGVAVLTALLGLLDVPFLQLLSPLLLLLTLCAAFFPLYYVFPDADLSPRQVVPGTVFAAVGWTVLGIGFGVYASVAGASVAGALGTLLLLVTWFYFSGLILLSGAVVNAVLAGVGGDALPAEPRDPPGGPPGVDRQVQHTGGRHDARTDMSDDRGDTDGPRTEDAGDAETGASVSPRGAPDIEELESQVEELRADLDAFEDDVTDRTVEKPKLEAELKRYVRRRMRRGKARGWGPYLVLGYGVVLTLGAFYYLQSDLIAVVAMLIIFLSTLGLYVLFVIFGIGLNALGLPGRAVDAVRERRG